MSVVIALGFAGLGTIFGGSLLAHVALYTGSAEMWRRAWGLWAVGSWIGFTASALDTDWPWTVFFGVVAVILTWFWWKNRRKGRRRRALRELGAKSRARVEALVRQMSPSPIPAPVGGGR